MADNQSFNDDFCSFANERGYKYKMGLIMLASHKDEILNAIASGSSKRMLWEFMCERGYYKGAYSTFAKNLQQLQQKSIQPTPEENVAKAPVTPAPETVKQVPAKRLESRSFEYEAPTPEAIKELYGEK